MIDSFISFIHCHWLPVKRRIITRWRWFSMHAWHRKISHHRSQ